MTGGHLVRNSSLLPRDATVCQTGKTRKALFSNDLRHRKRRDIFRGVMKRVPSGELFEKPRTPENNPVNEKRREGCSSAFFVFRLFCGNSRGRSKSQWSRVLLSIAEPREQPPGFLWGVRNPGKNSLTLWLTDLSELTAWSLPLTGRISELTTVETRHEPARSHHF